MDAATIERRYQKLLGQLNQAMLANNHQRVPLLRRIMAHLGHPDHYYHVIHIAGTNGKGSTGAMLSSVLQAQGYRVGRFSSPAINDAREQLQFNGTWISPADFIDTYHEILPVLKNMGLAASDVSVFEWFFLISVVWFRNQNVQWAVIEAGLGGLYDATNALASPQLTVFTKIALDHTAILGPTITAIAQNKSKIIKPHTTVVTLADQHPDALAVLQTEALNQGVRLVTAKHAQLTITQQTLTQMTVDAHSQCFDWTQLTLGLGASYQLQNLQLVLTVVSVLQHQQVNLTNAAVRTGLQQVSLPGRATVLQTDPLIIADGAHNPDGMRALVSSAQTLLAGRHLIWVVGVLQDKAYPDMLAALLPAADVVITNTPANPERALPAAQLARTATAMLMPAFMTANAMATAPEILTATTITDALMQAQQRATPDSAILVTGSFYVIRELQQAGWKGLSQ
ncbi:cyanophycin synthetase [Lactiplantibacillus pentosus]|uniref:bifunctional folylpolyglutamate synthase/dihydrofolate synthase n=1 Tax=Lactiplantibacillus pentosus TaxID=1589 RepID=UPI0020910DB3|nr:cyanophycin synthetase [Lactiplantibacillus pentosus]WMB61887.1 cyanophycin synthetase [Lactiplantibacillus pentosus]